MISVKFYGLGEYDSEFVGQLSVCGIVSDPHKPGQIIDELPCITHEALAALFLPKIKLPDMATITFGFPNFGQPGTIIMNGVTPIGAFLLAGTID